MYLIIKDLIDRLLSIILLIILLPLFIVIIICLYCSNIRKVFFTQERTGKDGKIFKIYKFCTFDTNKNISQVCLFLRNTGLDEIPQLINIIKGDMSFIGPRPWIVEYSKYFTDEQWGRVKVKPGITGYAQIEENADVFQKIERDLYYVNNYSLGLDLKIVIKTIIMVVSGKKSEATENNIKDELRMLKRNKYKKKKVK